MLSKTFAKQYQNQWFSLDELLESVLADVVSTDANFQLTQAKAWRDFGQSLQHLQNLSTVDSVEIAAGFGRIENLGIQELSVNLPLVAYRPSFVRRCWWGVLSLFGSNPRPLETKYQLAESNNRGIIELKISAQRTANGRWEIKHG